MLTAAGVYSLDSVKRLLFSRRLSVSTTSKHRVLHSHSWPSVVALLFQGTRQLLLLKRIYPSLSPRADVVTDDKIRVRPSANSPSVICRNERSCRARYRMRYVLFEIMTRTICFGVDSVKTQSNFGVSESSPFRHLVLGEVSNAHNTTPGRYQRHVCTAHITLQHMYCVKLWCHAFHCGWKLPQYFIGGGNSSSGLQLLCCLCAENLFSLMVDELKVHSDLPTPHCHGEYLHPHIVEKCVSYQQPSNAHVHLR